jgi:hypothetical protein
MIDELSTEALIQALMQSPLPNPVWPVNYCPRLYLIVASCSPERDGLFLLLLETQL